MAVMPDERDILVRFSESLNLDLTDNIDYGMASASMNIRVEDPQNTSASVETSSRPPQTTVSDPGALPKGPPPPLSVGADDIFWVNQLHTALADEGYYPGDEDIDDFYFGDSTQGAVMTFQACSGLTESGVVDKDTWTALLGPSLELKESRNLDEESTQNLQSPPHSPPIDAFLGNSADAAGDETKPYAELFSARLQEDTAIGPDGEVLSTSNVLNIHETGVFRDGHVVDDVISLTQNSLKGSHGAERQTTVSVATSHTETQRTAWPVLLEGDGGQEVHSLHVALSTAGFDPGEEDARWWQFGDSTLNALKTFQACSGLPESGVVDPGTWKALLGADAVPAEVDRLRSGASDDEDLADVQNGGRVWLMGEQRWENRSRKNI